MTVPTEFVSSKYPEALDSNTNLFLVHDSLRVVLSEDYDPSVLSTVVYVHGDTTNFPPTGIITLTEQCSEPNDRAISFFYTSKTNTTFEGLTPLPRFENTIVRKKRVTNVTLNVVAENHNHLKDALIAIQGFLGVKGTVDTTPFGNTIEGRINFLRKLVLSPRAWFSANKRIGLVPFEVEFKNESFRLGDGEVSVVWEFGDQTEGVSIISTISVTSVVPLSSIDVSVIDLDSGTVLKTFLNPGKYNAKLTITNDYGTDSIEFEDFINARTEAPIDAIIDFDYTGDQTYTPGTRVLNDSFAIAGPWETPPKIKSKINRFISMLIDTDDNYLNEEDETQRSNAGEELNLSLDPIDPIEDYEWILNDDLVHTNESFTSAAYSIGGVYDLILRAKTQFDSYKITKYEGAIDIIEDKNMFLFTLDGLTPISHEFGLISEEFKTGVENVVTLDFDNSFLDGSYDEDKAKFELKRNVGFSKFNGVLSGFSGTSLITYATGGATSDVTTQKAKILDFTGFSGLLSENAVEVERPWNWTFLSFEEKGYYLFGVENENPQSVSDSPAYEYKDTLLFGNTLTLDDGVALIGSNYLNGASDLGTNPNVTGEPKWSVNRSTVKDNTGYILRNNSVGVFFRLKSFYRTEGTTDDPVINLRKLQDMTGQVKTEGQLVSMTNGLFLFNNSGSVSAYNLLENKWEILSINSNVFKNFQDTTVDGYDNKANTLLATSDNERAAYISYDYSNKSFIKFSSIENTFTRLNPRPQGEQWLLAIY